MAFKSPARMDDVAPIADEMAKYARGTAPTTQDQQHAAALRRAAKNKDNSIQDLGTKDIPAKYKIEVFFGPKRTHNGPNAVVLSFWESGRRLHGGGDDLMFICRDMKDEKLGCGAIFSSDCVKGPFAVCPSCKRAINADRCTRFLKGRKTSMDLAKELYRFWRMLDGNADIYCKFDRTDIRYVAVERTVGAKRARELKGLSIYPLKNILTDTAAGADVVKRFYTFLTV